MTSIDQPCESGPVTAAGEQDNVSGELSLDFAGMRFLRFDRRTEQEIEANSPPTNQKTFYTYCCSVEQRGPDVALCDNEGRTWICKNATTDALGLTPGTVQISAYPVYYGYDDDRGRVYKLHARVKDLPGAIWILEE